MKALAAACGGETFKPHLHNGHSTGQPGTPSKRVNTKGAKRSMRSPMLRARVVAAVVIALAVPVAITRLTSNDPVAVTAPAPTQLARAIIKPVPRTQWDRIVAVGAWRPGCPARREDLRRVEVNHYGFDGKVHRGVLVVRRDVARDIAEIFSELFVAKYPIRRIRPVEEYDGDNAASLAADNTAAYNCRRPDQINAPVTKSPHANGRSVDINPVENPWMDLRCDCWKPSDAYGAKRTGPGVITEGSLPWRLFIERGWIWQDIRVPDYMHFDTGYPSVTWKVKRPGVRSTP